MSKNDKSKNKNKNNKKKHHHHQQQRQQQQQQRQQRQQFNTSHSEADRRLGTIAFSVGLQKDTPIDGNGEWFFCHPPQK